MKRKLTQEESKLCKIGINNRKKRIKELETELRYFKEFNAFNDKWAKYLEDKEIKQKQRKKLVIKETLIQLEASLLNEQESMKTEQNQLKFGVEVKKAPVGVN